MTTLTSLAAQRWVARGSVVRELPLVALATTLVAVAPALVTARILPPHDLLTVVASTALAVLLSVAATRVLAAAWARLPGQVLFSDLMLWSWLRRRFSEGRLRAARRRVAAQERVGAPTTLAQLTRMGRMLESSDTYTYGHSRRVARYAQIIARGLRLDPEEVERIRQAALVHDIGKLRTPREIITKPGRLTEAEFAVIRRHPADGADMLGDLDDRGLVAMVRHHHERVDGTGYPDGLARDAIPLGARIISVADTFDALTSTRTYRRGAPHKKALGILAAEAGTQLDGPAVAAFLRGYTGGRPSALAAATAVTAERLVTSLGAASAGVAGGAVALTHTLPVLTAATLGAATASAPAATPPRETAAVSAVRRAAPVRAARPVAARATPRPSSAPRRATSGARTPTTAGGGGAGAGAGGTTKASDDAAGDTATSRSRSTTTTTTTTTPTAGETTTSATPAGGGASGATTARAPAAQAPGTGATTTTTTATPAPAPAPATSGTAAPAATAPAPVVSVPALKTPAVTVPAVATPIVSVPAVTVGAITLPSVQITLPRLP